MTTIWQQGTAENLRPSLQNRSWKKCAVCEDQLVTFKTPVEFSKHLRENHCTKEGGSFVCKYGYNGVCTSLPLEGVSDCDYENHVARHHIFKPSLDIVTTEPILRKNFTAASNVQMSDYVNQWTVYNSVQNLSAVLNDPNRGKQKDFFTKTWGDSFVEKHEIPPCPYLPEINKSHFESYLRRTSKRYKRHIKRTSIVSRTLSNELGENSNFLNSGMLAGNNEQELEVVPKMFFQSNFSLDNQEIFSMLYPWLSSSPTHIGNSIADVKMQKYSQHSSKLLQEKLSHYLDVIEEQIAKQIALRSNLFFHAMTSHDALMEQLSTTELEVKDLRSRINLEDKVLVNGSLKILKLTKLQENYMAAYRKIKLMTAVHQIQPTVQLLLSKLDFAGALDLISTTQEILNQELQAVASFRHLGSQLAELEKVINKMMEADFIHYVSADLNRPLDNCETEIMEEERLVSILFGMLRQGQKSFVDTYRDESCLALKAILKQTIAEAVSQADNLDQDNLQGRIREQVRTLRFPQWYELLKQCFRNLSKILQRIQAVLAVMSDAISVAAGKAKCPNSPDPVGKEVPEVINMAVSVDSDLNGVISEEYYAKLQEAFKTVLQTICDQADDRCAKLITFRAKDGFFEKLTYSEFTQISKAVGDFVDFCELMCGRRSTQLQLSLQCQANSFITKFHEERKTKLNLILDSERWRPADVPVDFQELIESINTSGFINIPDRVFGVAQERKPQEVLWVTGEKFVVIGTVLILLKMVAEYSQCAYNIQYISGDVLTRLVDILQMFNSRTCQLVLGAGAIQVVGLKTITTRNLAVASRCLQLITLFVPKIKEHFESILTGKQKNRCRQFDQVLKDYNDHIEEINNKFVTIIEQVFDNQIQTWEVKPPVPSSCFRTICKQLEKLNEAIAEIIPNSQVQNIYININNTFKNRLKERLQLLKVSNDGGPQHGLVTSELAFYLKSLQSILCIKNDENLKINEIWEFKKTTHQSFP